MNVLDHPWQNHTQCTGHDQILLLYTVRQSKRVTIKIVMSEKGQENKTLSPSDRTNVANKTIESDQRKRTREDLSSISEHELCWVKYKKHVCTFRQSILNSL